VTATAEQYRDAFLRSLPPGSFLTREPASVLGQFALALGQELERIDARRDDLLREADPSQADELLLDWERVAGLPDPCNAGFALSEEERRTVLVTHLASIPSPTPEAILALAAPWGLTVTLQDGFRPARCGETTCSQPCTGEAWAHGFWITIFGAGGGPEAGFECAVRAVQPAHTQVRFIYEA
jgi:uncharacterized protein YmfQ (DUF2313 family)